MDDLKRLGAEIALGANMKAKSADSVKKIRPGGKV